MKLVIEIPEEIYQHYKKVWQKRSGSIPESCIAFGTPLPKGHGDLVDRDRVIDLLNGQEYNYYTELDKVVDTVYEAEAIIEADKEE